MITLLIHLLRLVPFLCGGHRQIALENLALHQQLAVYKRSVTRPKLRTTDRLCLPLIRPIGLMPPAASIRDAVHRRAAPSRLCPDSAAAQSEAWVRLSTAINVSASRCSSRRTLTGSLKDAVRRSRRRGPGIHVESSRSPARHTRFATASGAQ